MLFCNDDFTLLRLYWQLEKNQSVKITGKLQKGYAIFSLYWDMSDHDREADSS